MAAPCSDKIQPRKGVTMDEHVYLATHQASNTEFVVEDSGQGEVLNNQSLIPDLLVRKVAKVTTAEEVINKVRETMKRILLARMSEYDAQILGLHKEWTLLKRNE